MNSDVITDVTIMMGIRTQKP